MKRKVCLAAIVVVAITGLCGCRSAKSPPDPQTTPDESLAPSLSAVSAVDSGVLSLLEYVPSQWFQAYDSDWLGPAIYVLDVACNREQLGIPEISGADDRQTKLGLIAGLNTQGLVFFP